LPFDTVRLPFVVAGAAINVVRGKYNERNKEKLGAIGKRMFNAVLTLAAPAAVAAMSTTALVSAAAAGVAVGVGVGNLAAFVKNKISPCKANNADLAPDQGKPVELQQVIDSITQEVKIEVKQQSVEAEKIIKKTKF
jgi:hypothetical protein